MRILLICPDSPADSPHSLRSLDYLGHQIETLSLAQVASAGSSSTAAANRSEPAVRAEPVTVPEADVVVVDAGADLSLAPRIAAVLAAAGIDLPIVVVLGEGGLAAASAKWNVADIILTTAGPGEVEARLRLARDRRRAALVASAPGASSGSAGWTATSRSGTARTGSGATWAGTAGEAWPGDPHGGGHDPAVVVIGTLRIDETAFTADLGGRSLDLTYREFALLKFFASHPERVFTRDEILLSVWGDDYYGGTRTVDVHVRRLRAKLGKDLENAIHTVRNVGYRFSPDTVAEADEDTPAGTPGSTVAGVDGRTSAEADGSAAGATEDIDNEEQA
ncbi:transcriptional regulator [Brevibacterium sanguinis]|uniref:Transcriptional regulator n=2 Tax=Brevibacterium TaxID=1696 RepID=A0A366IJH2_9MICO|nr:MULTISPECIES: winged helix-turn-helix domain-containing protein [Brevibacterium]RBP65640.1 transcriptional regulator [Brevibacterium sanguinis]RBP72274.1 transcriptional regulator [Brevibacterium celere]